jgi:hypothetical protein
MHDGLLGALVLVQATRVKQNYLKRPLASNALPQKLTFTREDKELLAGTG